MATFQLLGGAKGLDFPGGASLKADKRGRVTVSEEAARLIRGSAAMVRYDAILEVAPARFHAKPDDFTCGCGFSPWSWQKVCPRCGTALEAR